MRIHVMIIVVVLLIMNGCDNPTEVASMTWKVSSTMNNSVFFALYDKSDGFRPSDAMRIGPGSTETFMFQCIKGHTLCYGAWNIVEDIRTEWGCGEDCILDPTCITDQDYCVKCEQADAQKEINASIIDRVPASEESTCN